ncbi:NYN domain-containing protein [Phycicoccus flavus]|uniref:NYN domain-containing protein n=1 Tax=Phycicoccus flavus TaxID=2502783 RepID=A0A8T6R2T9_9MICO|nr:NYN domain-containing protein [Phycicoccus flavus]NHA67953.1 NYN domain-containing protein [Phycicoccus flavus]
MTDSARIALLIDADNARARRIDVILGELSALGETTIRRAYGNWTKTELKGWTDVLHENAIRPVQQFDPAKGKNASDMALAVDAVEILHTQRPDAFAIVSSDADFTPLVIHLREHGVAVYGFGDAKTPSAFQDACTRFLVLDRLKAPSGQDDADETPARGGRSGRTSSGSAATPAASTTPEPLEPLDASEAPEPAKKTAKAGTRKAAATAASTERATRSQLRRDTKLVALLRRAIDSASDDDGWARIGTVGQRINNQSSFDSRNYGYAKLSKLIEATDLFEIRDIGTPDMTVRDPKAG